MKWRLTTGCDQTIDVEKIGLGAYSEVFKCRKGRSYKIFKPHKSQYWKFISRKTFDSQCEAYEIAKNSKSLFKLTPRYFGKLTISRIDPPLFSDLDTYAQILCYSIEYIENKASPKEHEIFMKEHESDFHMHGILYTEDCEIRKNQDGFKMIDFGTKPILERVEELCDYNEDNFSDIIANQFNKE